MNRRGFLHSAILAATALAVDPERLLWVPKLISIPKPGLMFNKDAFSMAALPLPYKFFEVNINVGPDGLILKELMPLRVMNSYLWREVSIDKYRELYPGPDFPTLKS